MGSKKRTFNSKASKLVTSFADYLKSIADYRGKKGRRHELWVCLILILIGNLCGKTTMCSIERYMKVREKELRKFLPLHGELGNGIPSHNTLSRIVKELPFEMLHDMFLQWNEDLLADVADKEGYVYADGKGVRAARPDDNESKVPYVLNALLQVTGVIGLYVALRKVGLKTNEIKVLPELLELVNLENKVVTVDAIGTQVKVVALIQENAAGFVLPLKANQEGFMQDVESHFKMMVQDGDFIKVGPIEDPKPAHGRIERRTAILVSAEGLVTDKTGFESIKHICLIKRERKTVRKNKVTKSSYQEVFYISDFCGDAQQFAQIVRDHWKCESAHWWLDHHLGEDLCTARSGNAIENLALLRRIVYNIVQLTCRKKGIEQAGFDAHFHSFANVFDALFKPLLIA